jgi:hypothetical protein
VIRNLFSAFTIDSSTPTTTPNLKNTRYTHKHKYTKNKNYKKCQKKNFFIPIPHPSPSLSFPSSSTSLSSILSLPSSFRIFPRSFSSLSLSFIAHVPDCLSLLVAHSAPFFLSFHSIPVFSLLAPTSEFRHHSSLSCTLSPGIPEFRVSYISHTLCCTLIL